MSKNLTSPLDQIIELINQTGDNCIILDSGGNPAYVVSQFEKYRKNTLNSQKVAEISKNQINEDISEIKEVGKSEISSSDQDNSLTYAKNVETVDNSDEKYYFEPID